MKIKYCFSVILVVLITISCTRNAAFDESVVIHEASWSNQDSPYFDITIDDTLSDYAFYFNIRHLENYRYSNLYLFLHTDFPNGNKTHDTIECILAYPDGKWIGKGSGSMRTSEILTFVYVLYPFSSSTI